MKPLLNLRNMSEMDSQEGTKHTNFRIDKQEHKIDDITRREEWVDVSPSGTEGIFIDVESPECDGE
jgi:hypothetical protein